jgi:photosystem II stability/assembly factor-like uncharacterized protein
MQKLVFRNGNGVEINLTDFTNYGITEWSGFSADGLNIQSQQVPFQDGSVFLDALMESRELSVTLAIQDNNDMERRYRLRRELISVMNPKLGEGLLIYTNDYISKQIHVIPQIPDFGNKNSNDSGTPKAQLSWTACSPYWEDLEDTEVTFQIGEQPIIKNEGDIPTQIEMDWFTNYVKNGCVTNITKNQKIQYDGDLTENLKVVTKIGQKSVTVDNMYYNNAINGAMLRDIIYVKQLNLIVIVGGAGLILTSSDGKNWQSRISNVTETLLSITYSETLGLFVAVGNLRTLTTSPDGINWTARTVPSSSGNLTKVKYFENIGFVVNGGSKILTSGNGIDWQETLDIPSFRDIVYANNLYILVHTNGTILTSPDGINWTSQTSGVSVTLSCIIYSEDLELFVVVGNSSTILTSPDGINWTSQVIGVSVGNFQDICYSDELNLFVVITDYNAILTSPDGINWTVRQSKSTMQRYLYAITYIDTIGLFLITEYEGKIQESSSGIEWTIQREGNNDILYDVTYSRKHNMFVAMGVSTLYTSPDGINWTRKSITGTYRAVTYVEYIDLFVAVGDSGYTATSKDGLSWSRKNTGISIQLNSIAYSEDLELFVVVGNSGTILTSSDGINWTSQTSGVLSDLCSICYSDELNLFVIVGSSGTILTSSDGVNWTSQSITGSYNLYALVYSDKLNMFISTSSGSSNNYIFTSLDGINWERLNVATRGLLSATFSDKLNMFVAVGRHGIFFTSSDGINWEEHTLGIDQDMYSIVYSNKLDLFVIVGDIGYIYYSNFTLAENRIQYLSADSDIGMNLALGDNKFRINKSDGNMVVRVKYRQKYIGV